MQEKELNHIISIRISSNMKELIDKLAEEDESTSSDVARNLLRIGLDFVYGDVSALVDKIDEEKIELTERLRYLEKVKKSLLHE